MKKKSSKEKPMKVLKTLAFPHFRFRLKVKLPDGTPAFVKLNAGRKRFFGVNNYRRRVEVENTALKELKDLAVPRLLPAPRQLFEKITPLRPLYSTTMEWLPWKDCFRRKLDVKNAIGIWLFVLEQVSAFREMGVLYTDLKPQNILLSSDGKAKLIDFEFCVLLSKGDRYQPKDFGETPWYHAPEQIYSYEVKERAVIYQFAMLLGSLIDRRFNNQTRDVLYQRIFHQIRELSVHHLAVIFSLSLNQNPKMRLKNIPFLYRAVLADKLPLESIQLWLSLRKPYEEILEDLGFSTEKARPI